MLVLELAVGFFLALWVLDAFLRLLWAVVGKSATPPKQLPLGSVVVLIPSRSEGAKVRATLESVTTQQAEVSVVPILVLDGPDPEAEAEARALGVDVLLKPDPGPTKAAALQFAARARREIIQRHEAVLILDVGSQLAPDFFQHLSWPEGADALQVPLLGHGLGPAKAAGLSEHLAQEVWDRGKQALGWSVRLRGTGTLFRSQVFLEVIPALETRIEDTETSLLMAARGWRAALYLGKAFVLDEKPSTSWHASRQRARWLVGQWELVWRKRRELLRLLRRRPLEGLAWIAMLASRPLSLTVPLRLAFGLFLAYGAWQREDEVLFVFGLLGAGSALAEVSWLAIRHPSTLVPACQLVWAWVKAVALAPWAQARWLKGRGK
ncbi:MAG: glycosyltransferase [Thermoanaerobaculum sp.]